MSAAVDHEWRPLILAVAPNGARKTKADHAALPITPEELAETAARCREAGASMIHLHVRDRDGRHSLDADAYRAATVAVRDAVGRNMIIQVTSESVGIYGPEEQMAMVRAVRPEAVSLAVREIVPDAAGEAPAAAFLEWLARERIMPQYILYAPEDVGRFADLVRRGVIPGERPFVLYVLGRYTKDQRSDPTDLLPYLTADSAERPWAVCAFGPRETACAVAAAALGGHARVGFENNLYLPDGQVAPDNAALVAAAAAGAQSFGRRPATADDARVLLGAAL
jgi:3-keto-5-aminohexanoate cleavage enzyme